MSSEESNELDLSILTYNIQQLPYSTCFWYCITGKHNQRSYHSTEILPDKIGPLNADIIVLNEVFIKSLYQEIKDKLETYGYKYSTEILNHNDWGKVLSGGVVVLSKYPILSVDHYTFRSCHFPEYYASKGFLYVKVQKGEVHEPPIHLFATHLNSSSGPRFERDRPCREMQMTELMEFYKDLDLPNTDPVIFAGDMNVNRYYREEYEAMLKNFDCEEPIYGDELNFTYDELNNPWVSRGEGRQWLDYVLPMKNHQRVESVSNEAIAFKEDEFDLSDHYAVLAKIKYKNIY